MSTGAEVRPSRCRDPRELSREGLCSLIPHGDRMCLLERVETWDSSAIRCSTDSHRDPDNPLRGDDGLLALHGLEYGAQAMAVHGALRTGREGASFHNVYMAAVHDLRLMVSHLDTQRTRLQVEARCLLAAHGNLVYEILLDADGVPLVSARITVMSRAGEKA